MGRTEPQLGKNGNSIHVMWISELIYPHKFKFSGYLNPLSLQKWPASPNEGLALPPCLQKMQGTLPLRTQTWGRICHYLPSWSLSQYPRYGQSVTWTETSWAWWGRKGLLLQRSSQNSPHIAGAAVRGHRRLTASWRHGINRGTTESCKRDWFLIWEQTFRT